MPRHHVARTTSFAVVALALAACSSGSDVSPAQSAQQVLTAALVDRYPACAGHTSTDQNASASCTVGPHTYLLYAAPPGEADVLANSLRSLHPGATVTVDNLRIWVED